MTQASVTPSKKHKTAKSLCIARRSVRIQNAVLPTRNHGVDYEVHEINGSDSEKEDRIREQPESNRAGNISEEKTGVDESAHDKIYLEFILAHEKVSGERISKYLKRYSANGSLNRVEIYKNLYIDSQKKIQALKSENLDLVKKLENALGKLDTYEKMGFPIILEKLKDVSITNSLSRAEKVGLPLKHHQPKKTSPNSGAASKRMPNLIDKTKKKKKTCKGKAN